MGRKTDNFSAGERDNALGGHSGLIQVQISGLLFNKNSSSAQGGERFVYYHLGAPGAAAFVVKPSSAAVLILQEGSG